MNCALQLFRPTLHGDKYLTRGKITCEAFPDGNFDAHKHEMSRALKTYRLRSFPLRVQDSPDLNAVDLVTLSLEGYYFVELFSDFGRASAMLGTDNHTTLEGVFEVRIPYRQVCRMTRGGHPANYFGNYVAPFCVDLHDCLRALYVKKPQQGYARMLARSAGLVVPIRTL